MNEDLLKAMIELVRSDPGWTGRYYTRVLHTKGFPDLNRHFLNSSILYRYKNIFAPNFDESGKPNWTVRSDICSDAASIKPEPSVFERLFALQDEPVIPSKPIITTSKDTRKISRPFQPDPSEHFTWDSRLSLHQWQTQALNEWQRIGYTGVVEAVTGGGKTRMALAAMEEHLKRGWKVAVLVPQIELMKQWHKVIVETLNKSLENDYKIGFLGDGRQQSLMHVDILIALPHLAHKKRMLPKGMKGLIVADECHHYGSMSWNQALEKGFRRRLGLTATYERSDSGIERFLDPYFLEKVYELDFEQALEEGVIAPFKVAFLSINFNADEQMVYDKHDATCRKMRSKLINEYQLDSERFDVFMKQVNQLASESGHHEANIAARFYRTAVNQRREITSNARHKFEALTCLADAVKAADRSILFAQTKHASRKASEILKGAGIRSEVVDSDMEMKERKTVFAAFEDGEHELIAAPMLLDEGIDVPAADLAIVVASSRSKRQMVQRMGRVLRKKEDGRLARIVILYVRGTSEDPDEGAQETFISMVTDAIPEKNVRYFDLSETEELTQFLNDMYE